ncbi:MAG: SDR family NAD(P)-dependent oxidoreductase [Candidatus Eisenbacteria sp.]|nr:SDR family NAD(P)-dependent oxidoreductase [Candidatus Eisenbacteria bacterium]
MAIEGKRIVLTGGAGFIGSQLAKRLVEKNEVVIYDNGHRNALKHASLENHANLTVIWGDVLDREAVSKAIAGSHIVVHLAAIAGVDMVMSMPSHCMRVNLFGTLNVLDACVEHKVSRMVDFSTSEVFGSYVYKAEEHTATQLGEVGESRWTYAVSKLAAEHMTYSYHKEHGIQTVTIRPFNVYGPQQVGIGAIHVFVVRALKGKEILIHGDGNQIRSWCYVDDMVAGALLCLEKEEAVGHVFNIGNPRATITTAHLAEQIKRLSASDSPVVFDEIGYPDVELRIPSIKKAQNILGYRPQVDLEEGLLRTIEWYRRIGMEEDD